jgi:uncharacterized protein YdbL (DUF1318 family)
VDNSVIARSDNQNRSLIITCWVLIGLVCLISVIPVLGFGSWLVVGPVLFIVLVMGIIVLARGGTLPGVFILLAALIFAPIFVFVAPFVSSLLGLGGGITALGTLNAASQAHIVTTAANVPAPPQTSETPGGLPADESAEGSEYGQLKAQVQGQSDQIEALKSSKLATEGVNGYLIGDEHLDIAQRRLVQQENVWREKIFDLIGQRTGHTREEVATVFASMARRSTVNPGVTPTN